MLIWLHGDGGSGNGYGSGFYPFTDADSAIVVTPSGTNQTYVNNVLVSNAGGLVVISPNGTKYQLKVDNTGGLSTTAI